eukprot:758426-Hanusia_phi.AAC.2
MKGRETSQSDHITHFTKNQHLETEHRIHLRGEAWASASGRDRGKVTVQVRGCAWRERVAGNAHDRCCRGVSATCKHGKRCACWEDKAAGAHGAPARVRWIRMPGFHFVLDWGASGIEWGGGYDVQVKIWERLKLCGERTSRRVEGGGGRKRQGQGQIHRDTERYSGRKEGTSRARSLHSERIRVEVVPMMIQGDRNDRLACRHACMQAGRQTD